LYFDIETGTNPGLNLYFDIETGTDPGLNLYFDIETGTNLRMPAVGVKKEMLDNPSIVDYITCIIQQIPAKNAHLSEMNINAIGKPHRA
jgi:hypothetical protein